MKKILIIVGKLYIGGAEKIARDIGFYADKSKFNIHYLVFGNEIGAYEKELTEAGCRIIHMDPPSKNYARYYSSLKKLFKEEKYDVIHSHTMFSSGWAMMAAKKCGVPKRISHSHSIRGFEKRGFIKSTYEKTMRELINRYSSDIIACGKSAGEWLYGKDEFDRRGKLIYNGISLDEYGYSDENRDKIRNEKNICGKFVIGHIGHLAKVKNQIFLVEMMPEILKRNADTILLLLGDGNDKNMLSERIASLRIQDSVIMTGNVCNVGEYLSAMDVLAFPSLYEGMPLTLVEAQANGIPCIISDKIPGDVILSDLIKINSHDDKNMWIDSILNASRNAPDKYLDEMKKLGFDTAEMLKKIYKLYEV